MIYDDGNDGSEPGAGYVSQDPDTPTSQTQPAPPLDLPQKIQKFLVEYRMSHEEFCARAGVDLKSLGNWFSYRHRISDRLGQHVEGFMAKWAKQNMKQTSLYDIVS